MNLIDYLRSKIKPGRMVVENPNAGRIQEMIRASMDAKAAASPKVRYEPIGDFEMSAYNPEIGQTDDTPWVGAWNNDLKKLSQSGEKIVADGSRRFKNGQKLRINNDIYTVRDRMNQRYAGKNNLDFFIPDSSSAGRSKAMNIGRKRIPVEAVYDIE